jgi:hypothetical protein
MICDMTGFYRTHFSRTSRWFFGACGAIALFSPAMAVAQSASFQVIASGTVLPRGSGSKAMLLAQEEAKLSAAKFVWNRLRGREDFRDITLQFTPEQNAAVSQSMLDFCNFSKLEEVKDKATKQITFRFSIDCPRQDLVSQVSSVRLAANQAAENSLDTPAEVKLIYLFMTRRVVASTTSSNDRGSYQASQTNYELVSSDSFEDVLSGRLNGVGLNGTSFADISDKACATIDIASVKKEFGKTLQGQSDYGLTSGTREQIRNSVKSCNYKYLAFGAAEIGEVGTDSITGQPLSEVIVSAQVLDLRGADPMVIARVRTNSAETGVSESTAIENAMKKAVSDVGMKLVEQIKIRGVQ